MVVKTFKNSDESITIEIDHDKCTGAASCIDVCPMSVFELVDDKATAPLVEECVSCCACVTNCPENAITHNDCP